jgi:CRISPR system Cascade subunit CasE
MNAVVKLPAESMNGVAARASTRERRTQDRGSEGPLRPRRAMGRAVCLDSIHKDAWRLFAGERGGFDERPFLFDFRIVGGSPAIMLRPRGAVTPLAMGQILDFNVRLAPVTRAHAGDDRSGKVIEKPVPDEALEGWAATLFSRAGFRVLAVRQVIRELIPLRRSDSRPLSMVLCSVTLEVCDVAAASRSYSEGIGRYRAYGCGTLVLSRRGPMPG